LPTVADQSSFAISVLGHRPSVARIELLHDARDLVCIRSEIGLIDDAVPIDDERRYARLPDFTGQATSAKPEIMLPLTT
jgi:hypothetical protein